MFLYIVSTIIVLIFLKKFRASKVVNPIAEAIINKNPFLFTGRITRLQYFITKLIICILIFLTIFCEKVLNNIDGILLFYLQLPIFLIIIVLSLFAASKRLRDIQWSQWLLIVWAIPYIGLVIGIPLLFVKSKINNAPTQE